MIFLSALPLCFLFLSKYVQSGHWSVVTRNACKRKRRLEPCEVQVQWPHTAKNFTYLYLFSEKSIWTWIAQEIIWIFTYHYVHVFVFSNPAFNIHKTYMFMCKTFTAQNIHSKVQGSVTYFLTYNFIWFLYKYTTKSIKIIIVKWSFDVKFK